MSSFHSLSTEPTSLSEALQSLITMLQLNELLPPANIPDALRDLEAELLSIGTDAYRAERQAVPMSEAARDFERFPLLAKFHTGIEDMLTLSLPEELLAWARRLLSSELPAGFETMVRSLVAHARSDRNAVRRSLSRFLVFEAVRLQLLLRMRLAPDETYAVGMSDDEMDSIAETESAHWLDDDCPWTAEVQSLDGIAIAGLVRLEFHLKELRLAMQTVGADLRASLERRARFEKRLFELDIRDAILVRNVYAEEFDVQRLSLEHVRERHPAVFGNVQRGALDTRLSRLRNTPPKVVPRHELRFIDLLRESGQIPAAVTRLGE